MAKSTPGEYTAGPGGPARRHDGISKQLTPSEQARVARIAGMRTGAHPYNPEIGEKEASELTNKYSEEVDFGEEV